MNLTKFFCLIDSIRIMSNCVFNYNLYFNYGSTYILRIIRGYRIASNCMTTYVLGDQLYNCHRLIDEVKSRVVFKAI